ncbi:MAG: hypothetical protein R3301_14985 [Saprospiraceae bacterium]|nr:hypothetical protein [Saprospiraceae bacterium]
MIERAFPVTPGGLLRNWDGLGALARIHERLYRARVNVYAANGVTVGDDAYGYIVYIRHEDLVRASAALGV